LPIATRFVRTDADFFLTASVFSFSSIAVAKNFAKKIVARKK